MISLEIHSRDLERVARDVAATQQQAERALKSALRKIAAWLRIRSVKGLSDELQIQQKIIRRRLRNIKTKNTANGAEATIWYGLDPIAMIYLGARKTADGVKASGGRQVQGAFIAHGKNQSRQVFKRRSDKRLPIEKQTVEIQKKAERYLDEGLLNSAEFEQQFFEHELKWQTR